MVWNNARKDLDAQVTKRHVTRNTRENDTSFIACNEAKAK